MSSDAALRVLALCVVLACAETLHGIARTILVVPRIGKEPALKLSALTGSTLAFAICFVLVPPIELRSSPQLLALGVLLACFMAGFDITLGRLLLHRPWSKIWPEFDPRTGNFLLYGLAFLTVTPWLVNWLRT